MIWGSRRSRGHGRWQVGAFASGAQAQGANRGGESDGGAQPSESWVSQGAQRVGAWVSRAPCGVWGRGYLVGVGISWAWGWGYLVGVWGRGRGGLVPRGTQGSPPCGGRLGPSPPVQGLRGVR